MWAASEAEEAEAARPKREAGMDAEGGEAGPSGGRQQEPAGDSAEQQQQQREQKTGVALAIPEESTVKRFSDILLYHNHVAGLENIA